MCEKLENGSNEYLDGILTCVVDAWVDVVPILPVLPDPPFNLYLYTIKRQLKATGWCHAPTALLPTAMHGGRWPRNSYCHWLEARPSSRPVVPTKTAQRTDRQLETPPVPVRESRTLYGERRPPYKSHARSLCLPASATVRHAGGARCGSTSSSRPWRSCSPGRGATAPRTECPGSRLR